MTISNEKKLERLDYAFLFLLGLIGIIFQVIQLTIKDDSLSIISFYPLLISGVFIPFYIGYIKGAVEYNSPIERFRGWIYFGIAIIIYVTNTTELMLRASYQDLIFLSFAFFFGGLALVVVIGRWVLSIMQLPFKGKILRVFSSAFLAALFLSLVVFSSVQFIDNLFDYLANGRLDLSTFPLTWLSWILLGIAGCIIWERRSRAYSRIYLMTAENSEQSDLLPDISYELFYGLWSLDKIPRFSLLSAVLLTVLSMRPEMTSLPEGVTIQYYPDPIYNVFGLLAVLLAIYVIYKSIRMKISIREGTKYLSLTETSRVKNGIASGIDFLKRQESDHPGKYWEVHPKKEGIDRADRKHNDFKIHPQSQYLLYITFKRFGQIDHARKIFEANDFKSPVIDRQGLLANSRYCVLDDDIPPFHLQGWEDSINFDEKALIGHYWALNRNIERANMLANDLRENLNSTNSLLGMDEGDKNRKRFPIYKTALAGTLFARVGMIEECKAIAKKLQELQETEEDEIGGWRTDMKINGQMDGVANIETTCLALICLDCAEHGCF